MMLDTLKFLLSALIEIGLLFVVLYFLLRFLHGTRGAGILRGLLFMIAFAILVLPLLVGWLGLNRLMFLAQERLGWVLAALIVLFQPEFRRALMRLGEAPMMRWFFKTESPVVAEVVRAAGRLSELGYGGLIALEREIGLGAYIEGGRKLDSEVSADLLVSIFWPNSPLHDGAVVIRGNRIAAAGCLFPLSDSPSLATSLGTRHRAGMGVTEESDAIAIIISEETRGISLAYRGQLRRELSRSGLQRLLDEIALESTGGAAPANAEQRP
jgi:diadenylate cyclase